MGKARRKSEVDLGDDVGWWAVRNLAKSRREGGGNLLREESLPPLHFLCKYSDEYTGASPRVRQEPAPLLTQHLAPRCEGKGLVSC